MLRIGEFSRLSQVPVKTLRYYAEIGLLVPAEVDRYSSYRYYTLDQLADLNRILALKDLGFKLEEIARLLETDLSTGQLQTMLHEKQAEVEAQIAAAQNRLARIAYRLTQLEEGPLLPEEDVIVKRTPALRIAGLRAITPDYYTIGCLYEELFQVLERQDVAPAGPTLALYYDEGDSGKNVDVEVAVPIQGDFSASGRVKMRELPEEQVAALIRRGPYDDFTPAYSQLISWIQANGYQLYAPAREIYLRSGWEEEKPEAYLVEIQMPVTRTLPANET